MISKRNRPVVGSIFSDPSGRRRKRIRRIGYVAAGGCVTYMGLVAISLTGGPISPEAVLPPGVPDTVEGLLNPESSQAGRDGSGTLADGPMQPAAQPDGEDWVNRGTAFNPPGSRGPQPGISPTPGGDTPTTIVPPVPAPTESPVPVEPPATTAPPPPSEPPTLPSSPVDPTTLDPDPTTLEPTTLEPPVQVDPSSLPTSPTLDPTGGTDVPTAPDSGGVGDTPSLPESPSG
jgi:hypothetical protein